MSIKIQNGEAKYFGTGLDINPQTGGLELYVMGNFVSGWLPETTVGDIIKTALYDAYQYGKGTSPLADGVTKLCADLIAALDRSQKAHAETLEECQLLTMNCNNLTNKVAALLVMVQQKGAGGSDYAAQRCNCVIGPSSGGTPVGGGGAGTGGVGGGGGCGK